MSKSFHQRVIEIIKMIPPGRVVTYGQIAALAGNRFAQHLLTQGKVVNAKRKSVIKPLTPHLFSITF
jgi:alkylated DNA nucleotide flippase Atl1